LHEKLYFLKRNLKIAFSRKKISTIDWEIIINPTYKCNQKCSYCYAKNTVKNFPQDMTIADFKRVLRWVKPQNLQILFAGGEPTQHPDFTEMLDICKKNKMKFRIATNALFEKPMTARLSKQKTLRNLINYNARSFYSKSKNKIFLQNLKQMHKNRIPFIFYYNIRKTDALSDYDELIKKARRYDVNVGICLTVPHNLDLADEAKKTIYLIENAKRQNVKCSLVRPVPKCMFSKNQWKKIKPALNKYYHFSVCDIGPVIVNPDLSVFPCNSLNSQDMKGPSILNFKNLDSVFSHYRTSLTKRSRKPLDKKCISCAWFYDLSCQGGCLANK